MRKAGTAMASESKKLALLRILDILRTETDADHPLTQEEIAAGLQTHFGIEMERKAVGRNLSLLAEAGYDVVQTHSGAYLNARTYEPSEIRLLIDAVLSSRYISARQSRDLIDRLAAEENRYFRKNVRYIHAVDDFHKTGNREVFYSIDLVSEAIDAEKAVVYDYYKYGADGKLHRSSRQCVTPYCLILHNQRYYLMGYSRYWGHMVYHRLDRIRSMTLSEEPVMPIREVRGFEGGIDFRTLTTAMPYMFSDPPERITFLVDEGYIDHVIDWFGEDVRIAPGTAAHTLLVSLTASPNAMHYWALQFAEAVEVLTPASLRDKIRATLKKAKERYDT